MAEMILVNELKNRNINEIKVDSAGTYGELDSLIDKRAAMVLENHKVPYYDHYSKKISFEEINEFDVIIAMAKEHYDYLKNYSAKNNIYMLNHFNPEYITKFEASNGAKIDFSKHIVPDIADPWYGDIADFENCYLAINKTIPSIIKTVESLKS
jgi:protein-tyrosine phosphatase